MLNGTFVLSHVGGWQLSGWHLTRGLILNYIANFCSEAFLGAM
jgi:hypothetical protein